MATRGAQLLALVVVTACLPAQEPAEPAPSEPEPPASRRAPTREELEAAVEHLRAAAARPSPPEVASVRFEAPLGERWTLVGPRGEAMCALPCTRPASELAGARVRRDGEPAASLLLPVPEGIAPRDGETAVVRAVSPRGSPLGALALGIVAGNAVAFGGALAVGFCRSSENNEVQSSAGCGVAIGAALGGAAALAAAVAWGTWSRRGSLESCQLSAVSCQPGRL